MGMSVLLCRLVNYQKSLTAAD